MTEITKQNTISLSLLAYLTAKGGSTFTDDYYHHLKSEGYSAFDIGMTVERLINSGEIIYLGNDKYWIQITPRGRKFVENKGKDKKYSRKEIIDITAAIVGIIGVLIALLSWLC